MSSTTETREAPTTTAAAITAAPDIQTRDAALSRVREAIVSLTTDNATAEDFLTVQHTLAGLKQAVSEYVALANAASLEFLEKHGPVQTDTERYYVGTKKVTKCRDTRATVEAILTVTGGDLDKLCELLGSQPLKHGGCRSVLGDGWSEHFEVVETPDVATGKPKKEVKRVDPRFLPATGREEGE